MPDQLRDTAIVPSTEAASSASRHRRRRRTDWRLGGRAVRKWDLSVLAVALIALGVGAVGGGLVSRIAAPWAPIASTVVLWAGMLVPIVFAFARARPAGLLKLRPVDLLWGLGLGLGLRLLQGWMSGADAMTFPSATTLDGALPTSWWLTEALPAAVVAPVVEELFFRAVVLVAVYQLLRRRAGGLAAAVTGLLVSTGGFILLHASAGALTVTDAMTLFAVGGTCALLVLLTGRIWPAVLTHAVFNATYLALVVAGTVLS
ncbi:CPBP family intramembrane glutamic endopeptidase [Microbacterium memoriense]|uniref:CPBP family intramembrane metalloprotease n=1 Tax=Microbacterium memoriense TaxID=2978350 RepID=A0ABT2PBJ2_9MICO|nr:CPBP family intramembrane glutamic endopeptidase [Microbacterium memoriense]MCT9001932.1 CPBP family intramembrane metalloprotease [Microbacterium memoriense]